MLLVAGLFAPGCIGETQCLAACVGGSLVTFSQPFGAPGDYSIRIGPVSCAVTLPAALVDCGASGFGHELRIEHNAIVEASWKDSAPSTIDVEISRDGKSVLSGQLRASSRDSIEICGSSCTTAYFTLQVPDELAPSRPSQCAPEPPSGSYAVVAEISSPRDGGCGSFDLDDRLEIAEGGGLVGDDGSCLAREVAWSSSSCQLSSKLTCGANAVDAWWSLTVEDAVGDGSILVGQGTRQVNRPVECQSTHYFTLRRQ